MTNPRKLLVTHHAPDLDAVGAVWLFKRFDTHHYGTAQMAFVNPGETLSIAQAEHLGFTGGSEQIVHVDTGLGQFDHHQPDRGQEFICATSLVYDHLCERFPDYKNDQALKQIVEYITEIDHFREIYWPEAGHIRYSFMIHELLKGIESINPHDDDSMLHFGMTALDAAYYQLTIILKAYELIDERREEFDLSVGKSLAIETNNDDTIKVAQKQGYMVVVRRDPDAGNIRIKARPDAEIDLKPLYDSIVASGDPGDWYYHPSGKMLLNGSSKHRNQTPTKLTIPEVIRMLKETYGI